MDCKKTKLKISGYIDGDLSGREFAEFEAHVKSCASCKKELEQVKNSVKELRAAKQHKLQPSFYVKLNRKLDAADEKKKKKARAFGINHAAAAAAAICVMVIAVVVVKQVNKDAGVSVERGEKIIKERIFTEGAAASDETKGAGSAPPRSSAEEKAGAEAELAEAWTVKEPEKKKASADKQEEIRQIEKTGSAVLKNAGRKSLSAGFTADEAAPAALLRAQKEETVAFTSGKDEFSGDHSGVREFRTVVIKEPNDFYRNTLVFRGISVDFSTNMIIAAFAGEKPSAGYSVRINSIEQAEDKIIVKYSLAQPGEGMMAAQVITTPFHIKIIEKASFPVEFVKE